MKRPEDTDNPSDVMLTRRAQTGDSAALTELVARYQDRIYNTCYRMCRNEADALDLTQTTFMKAIEALPRFETKATFFTWIYRIAVNLTLTHRRDRARRPTLKLRQYVEGEEREIEPPAPDAYSAPERRAEASETRAALERALDALDDDFKAAVILRDVEDLDYAAIAEILNVPTGTVKSRIYRGRMMLREYLEREASQLDVG